MNRRAIPAVLLLSAALIIHLALVAAPAQAAPKCFGKAATIVGTGGKDTLIGTPGADVIVGRGGADVIEGRGGADRLCGGKGKDFILGQAGHDRMNGNAGHDIVGGNKGSDILRGGPGDDELYGGAGPDSLFGGGGLDWLVGNKGKDAIFGGGGQDILLGMQGNDTLKGGPGPFDVASFLFANGGVIASLATNTATGEGDDTLKSVEILEGSSHDDSFVGNAGENYFWDTEGNDSYSGDDGFDGISFFYSEGGVVVDLGAGTAMGQGDDTLVSIEGAAGSSSEADDLTGSGVSNILIGFGGPDELFGLEGDDVLEGGAGDDLLEGGPDEDTGDGGRHVEGDVCIDVEHRTECETIEFSASSAARGRGGSFSSDLRGFRTESALSPPNVVRPGSAPRR